MVLFGDVDETMFQKVTEFLVGEDLAPEVTFKYSELVPPRAGKNFDYTAIMAQEVRDLFFTCSTRRLARFISETSTADSTYMYLYEHNACPSTGSDKRFCSHTCHGCEIPFEFNTMEFAGRNTDEGDDIISSMFSDYWKEFVRTGAPQSSRYASWPKYKEEEQNGSKVWTSLRLRTPQTETQTNYNENFCDFWDATNVYVKIDPDQRARSYDGEIETRNSSSSSNQSNLTVFVVALLLALLI